VARRRRRLVDAHGEVEYVAGDPDVAGALDAMRDQLARRWGDGEGPRIFRGPGREAFTRASVDALVAAGLARVDCLTVAGKRVTVSTVLRVGDREIGDATSADPDYGRFGVGQAAIHGHLVHALEAGTTEVDLRAGDFPHKRRWGNDTVTTRSVVLSRPGRRGEIARQARRAAMSLRARRIARLEAGAR
jgi:CelD/BcsL family acetyltransferase involved in cellulose biosynthesis